jgi:hypothetical protein
MALDVTRSTVKVFGQKGVGTGFVLFVLDQVLVFTCAHVVGKEDSRPRIVFSANSEEGRIETGFVFYSPEEEYDIAVLQVTGGLPDNVPPLKLGRSIGSGDHPFHTFGYPEVKVSREVEVEGLHCDGTIEGEVKDSKGRPFLQLTSDKITSGVSGAPLFDDETGRIVGMIHWAAIKPWEHLEEKIKAAIEERKPNVTSTVIPQTAFAIPAETLFRLLHGKLPTLQFYPPQELDDYLRKVDDYCDQDPYRVWDIRPSLKEIYVPLQLRYRPPIENREVAKGAPPQEKPFEQILPAAEALAKSDKPHLVIVAGPGAGKSTLLRQFAKYAWAAPQTIGLSIPHIPLPVPLGKIDTEASVLSALAKALTPELSLMHDLPAGFWDDWPKQTEAHWLILLDALDEVPSGTRKGMLDRVRALAQMSAGSRIVITVRPSGYTYGELDPGLFKHYELDPFGTEQMQAFSSKWLGDVGESFLVEYDRLEAGDLKNTPLLLTLAARIYKEKQSLPTQRSALYGELVDRSLDRAIDNGLNTELGRNLEGNRALHVARLAYLAQRMTKTEQTYDSKSIEGFMSDHFQEKEERAKLLAKTSAEQWSRVMGRRSGLLIGNQGSYKFLHPTVREYLTAKYLLDGEGLQEMLLQYWHQPRYDEVLAFALSIRATENGGGADIVNALTCLIVYGADTYQHNPQELFAIRHSPLRIVLHLVRDAGLVLTDFSALAECLRTRISVSELRQRAIACDSRAPEMILKWLSEAGSEEVQYGVAENPSTPQEVLRHLAEIGGVLVQEGVAKNPSTPQEVLRRLAEVGNEEVQRRVAQNPNAPAEALWHLAEVGSKEVTWVATNPSTPLELSKCLAEICGERTQFIMALSPRTPPELLEHVAEIGSEIVQGYVAKNPSTPQEVLKRFAEIGSVSAQKGVARNPSTPQEVLKRLAEVGGGLVQGEVAENPNTPQETLKHLAEVGSEWVQSGIARNPSTPQEVLKRFAEIRIEVMQEGVAVNPNTPLEVLRQLAEIGSEFVQCGVAQNPNAPAEALRRLAEVGNEEVQRRVAQNPNAPAEALKHLAEVGNENVQKRVAENPITPPEVLKHLAETGSQDMRRLVARKPNVILETL